MKSIYFSFILLIMGYPFKALAGADITWSWDGAVLKYEIYKLYSVAQNTFDCGRTGKDCYMEMITGDYPMVFRSLWKDDIPYTQPGTSTAAELIRYYNDYKLPKNGLITNYQEKDCTQVFLRDKTRMLDVGNTCSGTMTPPPPPPGSVSCNLNSVVLQHPPLEPDAVNGNTVSKTMSVTCTRQATVRIIAQANDGTSQIMLRADGSLKSALTVNGKPGTTGDLVTIPGPAGKSVIFTSTLIASGKVAAGNFSGAGIVNITII
ncbi:hypothetical protein [Serratia nevei]|uniref:MrpH family fimbial adhesin n=1 Tax=Serratia nevei TaxID=2703794 RepID=UPI00313DB403